MMKLQNSVGLNYISMYVCKYEYILEILLIATSAIKYTHVHHHQDDATSVAIAPLMGCLYSILYFLKQKYES